MKTFNNLKEGVEIVTVEAGLNPIPKTLPAETITRLTNRLGDEYQAYYIYRAASDWCQNMGFFKAASYFKKEMEAELEHAESIRKYLTDWNVMPQIPESQHSHTFVNLIDIINKAYIFELNLMNSYVSDSQALFTTDLITFDFLQKYRTIQHEAVAEFSDLLNGANLVNLSNKLDVLYFENQYFG